MNHYLHGKQQVVTERKCKRKYNHLAPWSIDLTKLYKSMNGQKEKDTKDNFHNRKSKCLGLKTK